MCSFSKPSKNPIGDWHKAKRNNLLNSLLYRMVLLCASFIAILVLFFLLALDLNLTNLSATIYGLSYILLGLYLLVIYAYRSSSQMLAEFLLLFSIYRLRKEIEKLRKQRGKTRDYSGLQIRLNVVRRLLKDFIEVSDIISPPIYNYELIRLQKGIDTFFNSASITLFPIPQTFSRAEKIEQQLTLAYYESQEHPTDDEIAEQEDEMRKAEMGEFDWFGNNDLDEFSQYLGDALFSQTARFSPFSNRHSMNLILLSRFFDYWNSALSKCRNCYSYNKVKGDVEEHYQRIIELRSKRRERAWGLRDSTIIVVLTVVLTTISTIIIRYLLG